MSELKFDRARFDAGEIPARTRDGHKVLHVHDSGLDVEWPIVAWLDEFEFPETYTNGGELFGDGRESDLDLVHETRMRKVLVVVYRKLDSVVRAVSEEEARDFDRFCDNLRAEGQIFQLLEVEVPE